MHLVYPPKFCITILLGITVVPREIEDNGYVEFGGQTMCIMAYVRMVNSEHFCQSLSPSLFRGSTVSRSLEQTMISRFTLLRLPLLSKSKMATTRGKIWLSVLPKCSFRMKKQLIHMVENLKKKRTYRIPRGSKPQGREDFSDTYSYFSSIIDYVVSYR